MGRAPVLLLGAFFVAACTVDPLSLEGRECPCVDGWVCDEASDTCVPSGDTPDAGPAGASDARASIDAGAADTGPEIDAAPSRDAGVPLDAPASPDVPVVDPPDSGSSPTACATAHASRPFCDGFESGDLGGWDGTYTPNGSSVTVIDSSDGPVYRGAHSLRARAVMGSESALVHAVALDPTLASDYWLRAYYYFPSTTDLGCEITGQLDLDDNHLINSWASDDNANIHSHGLVDDDSHSELTPPARDRWVCVEVHVAAGATGALELYFDGTPASAISPLDTTLVRALQGIEVGVVWKDEPDPPQELYVDEVVADTSRIGCD